MDGECDTNIDDGHQWCLISGTITENELQAKTALVDTKNLKAATEYVDASFRGIVSRNTIPEDITNSVISFPKDNTSSEEDEKSSPTNPTWNKSLITAIRLSYIKNDSYTEYIPNGSISSISQIYYCKLEDLFKTSKWRVGDINGDGPIPLSMYQTDDMPIAGSTSISLDATDYVFINPMADYEPGYALTDVYYRSPEVGKKPANAVCFAFKKVLDLNSPKVYYSLINGVYQKGNSLPSGDWLTHTQSRNGEFISQLSMVYLDEREWVKLEGSLLEKYASAIGSALSQEVNIEYIIIRTYFVGFKGFSSVKMVNFDPTNSNSFYNYPIDDARCCNLLPEEQYGENTYEYSYCRNVKSLVVSNDSPYGVPNAQCKVVLSNYCTGITDEGYKLETELCGAYCAFDDTNCDNAIRGYCSGDDFYKTTTGANPTRYLSLKKLYDDDICGCVFSTTEPVFRSYPVTLQKTLEQRLVDPSKISPSIRTECTLPQCKKSNYKLYAQKLALKNKACTDTEKCIGDGFVIPSIIENNNGAKLECKSFINTGNCVDPPEGVMAIMPDPFTSSCKNTLKDTSMNFPIQPQFCVLGKTQKVGGCVNNKQLLRREVSVPGIPDNDPNWCPKPNSFPPYEEYDSCDPPSPPSSPADNNTLRNIVFITVVLFLIIFYIFFIIKLI